MDEKFLKADTNFLPEKPCGASHEHEYDDRISELPDEIKVKILSSLPVSEAAAASVLSSRWLDLWKHTPTLNFEFNTGRKLRSWAAHKCKLCLQYVKVSGEAMELILRRCTLLEELVISLIFLTSDVELCGASLMLKRLEVSGCRGGKLIKISTPNLEWLSVDELSGKLLLENVPKHVRADFNIYFGWQSDVQRFASAVFFCISSQLTFLNLTLYAPEMFLAYGLVKMPTLKSVVVVYHGLMPPSLLSLTALIWAAPRLEEFKLEIRVTCKDPYVCKKVKSHVETSPHQHLRVFELAPFFRGIGDIVEELVTYIVNNCIALQKIIFGGRSWFHYCEHFRDFEDDGEARDYAKQLLQDKLPQYIQTQLL